MEKQAWHHKENRKRNGIDVIRKTLPPYLVFLFGLFSSPRLGAAPPLQNCQLSDYGEQLPIAAFQTLDAARKGIRANTANLVDLSAQAYQDGYLKRLPGCTDSAVRLLGSVSNVVLELKALNYQNCKALKSSPLLAANNVEIVIGNIQTGRVSDCNMNPVTEYFPLVGKKLPGMNNVSLMAPSLRGWSARDCEPLYSASNTREKRRVDQALSVIRQHGSWSARKLDKFERNGGEIRICTDRDTALNDFDYKIDLGTRQLASWDIPTLVRVLLEEIAHANRSTKNWPQPHLYSKTDFVRANTKALLDMEAEGWIFSWIDSEGIRKRNRMPIPLMTLKNSFCLAPGGNSQRVEQLWRDLKRALTDNTSDPSLSQEDAIRTVANRCVKFYEARRDENGKSLTYREHYAAMSANIYDCNLNGELVVRRGRPMCDETFR